MSRTLTILLILAVCSGMAGAAPLASSDGLPPELTISAASPLEKQLPLLQGLSAWTEANRPKGGGFLSSFFTKKVPSVTAAVLALNAQSLLEQARAAQKPAVVSVTGVYQAVSPEAGLFPFAGGTLRLSVPVGVTMQGLPTEGPDGLPVTVEGVLESTGGVLQLRAALIKPSDWLTLLRIARVQELMNQPDFAVKTYADAQGRVPPSDFAAFAKTSAGRIPYEQWRAERDAEKRKPLSKRARGVFSMAWNSYAARDRQGRPKYQTWWPRGDASGWDRMSVHQAIGQPLDAMNRNDFWYRFMDFFVALAGGSHWLGIVLLSIMSRVVIWPLTKKQLASAESMKRLQPQIKALQERHTDDKQQFQAEFWKLCQANGVNPLGGCLPMIVQFPVLIMLWQGIRNYIVQFQDHGFLWVRDLASPDYGLLIAYTISMVLFQKMTQKLTPTPTMNPQQAQQQQMMTYMMPAMFFFFFKDFPAAFLLYWLATNLVYFAQQYSYTVTVNRKASAGESESLGPAAKPGGFAGVMTRMMSRKAADDTTEETPPETRSFHEKQAESKGKKVGRPDDKGVAKKPSK